MSTITVTDANRGQEVAVNGVLTNVVLKKVPVDFLHGDNLTFARGEDERVVFNMHIATSAVSVDSILFSGSSAAESFILTAIPDGCEVEITVEDPPTLTSLSPDTAVSGDPDFVLSCIGTGFTDKTVIRFGSTQDEPTTLVSDTEVTTGVKPSLFAPAVVPVAVHNGDSWSEWVDFTFTEPVEEEPSSA
jgi:hypothetical protein